MGNTLCGETIRLFSHEVCKPENRKIVFGSPFINLTPLFFWYAEEFITGEDEKFYTYANENGVYLLVKENGTTLDITSRVVPIMVKAYLTFLQNLVDRKILAEVVRFKPNEAVTREIEEVERKLKNEVKKTV